MNIKLTNIITTYTNIPTNNEPSPKINNIKPTNYGTFILA